jgi:hypothetical protein
MRKVLRGYAKDKDGNLILIGTIPVPHSKDKPSPRERQAKRHLVRQGATRPGLPESSACRGLMSNRPWLVTPELDEPHRTSTTGSAFPTASQSILSNRREQTCLSAAFKRTV